MVSTPTRPAPDFAGLRVALVQLLLGDSKTATRGLSTLARAGSNGVELAEAWRVLPQLQRRASAHADDGTALPMGDRMFVAAARSTWVCHTGAQALAALEDANIPAAAFKGLAAIAQAYGSAAQRMVRDVDVLVRKDDLEPICKTLAPLGFEPFCGTSLDRWLAHLERRTDIDNAYLVLLGPDGLQLDLHWRVGAGPNSLDQTATLLARSQSVAWSGSTLRAVSPEDAQCLTVYHALHDHFAPASLVKDLCDLSTWWSVHPGRWDLDSLISTAVELDLAPPLLAFWKILDRLGGTPGVEQGIRRLDRLDLDPDSTDRIQRVFWAQLENGPLNLDLLRLANPRMAWAQLRSRFLNRRDDLYFRKQLQQRVGLPASVWPSFRSRIAALFKTLFTLKSGSFELYRTVLRVQDDAHLFDGERKRA